MHNDDPEMLADLYVLEGHTPVHVTSLREWSEKHRLGKRVDITTVGTQYVSTVFLGTNHNYRRIGPPILFETMILDSACHGTFCRRYATWDEAQQGHDATVAALRAGTLPRDD